MQRLAVRIIVAHFTFTIGFAAFSIWISPFFQNMLLERKPCSFAPREYKISDLEAAEMAECFVAAQGYTIYPPTEDKSKWQSEFHDIHSPEETIKRRHNTIESDAYGVKYEERRRAWSVVFRFNLEDEKFDRFNPEIREQLKITGRVVMLDDWGDYVQIMHEDSALDKFNRIEEVTP